MSQPTSDRLADERAQPAITSLIKESMFPPLADTINAAIFIFQGSRLRYVNPLAQFMTGYPQKTLLTMDFWQVIHPDYRELVRTRGLRRQQGDEVPASYEVKLLTQRGYTRWVLFSGRAIDLAGEPAVLGTAVDITDRKRAEQQLAHRNRQLEVLSTITTRVTDPSDPGPLFTTLKMALSQQLGIPGGIILIYDENTDQLCLAEAWGLPEALVAAFKTHPVTTFHREQVLPKQHPILWPDFRHIVPFLELELDAIRPNWQSYLGVPFLANAEAQGILGMFGQASTTFNTNDIKFYALLGQQVGITLLTFRLYKQAHASHSRLQTLSRRLVAAQESERGAIARELHDEIGQALTGLKLHLETTPLSPPGSVKARLQKAQTYVSDLIRQVRGLSLALRPAILDDLGLLPALLWHLERFTEQTGILISFEHSELTQRLQPELESAAFRIVQEALTNVARHAGVGEATVRLWTDASMLGVQIQDAGPGFALEAVQEDYMTTGLRNMQDRVTSLGGHLTIESAPGKGTRVTAEWPLSG